MNDEKHQFASHNNWDTIREAPITVFHQQQYEERNLPTLKNNAKMIMVPTLVINAEQGVPTDTRDTVLENNHHLDKTRKPKNNMNQARIIVC